MSSLAKIQYILLLISRSLSISLLRKAPHAVCMSALTPNAKLLSQTAPAAPDLRSKHNITGTATWKHSPVLAPKSWYILHSRKQRPGIFIRRTRNYTLERVLLGPPNIGGSVAMQGPRISLTDVILEVLSTDIGKRGAPETRREANRPGFEFGILPRIWSSLKSPNRQPR